MNERRDTLPAQADSTTESYRRSLLDCAKTDAANVLVSSAYLSLFSTLEANSSMSAPVWLLVPDCDNAEAAKRRAVADEFSS